MTSSSPGSSDADLAIRLRRAAFNHALAQGDLAAIGPLLAQGAQLITGTDSAVLAGRKAQLTAWKREFAAQPRTIYLRKPERIVASSVEPIALEHGVWTGTSSDLASGGEQTSGGDYTAKWRKIAGDWVIEAELYLTLR
ncbi:YybH family protein [Novosphingobium rosa]|uniref:YybH family protein n=1 Tax=Novosphingobium rosa TaxID=76978 RepID=UPI00083392E0|nr:nuclear transport factor 2 family protein [Novosphingobium rosa]